MEGRGGEMPGAIEDMTMYMFESREGEESAAKRTLRGHIVYNSDLFDASSGRRMASHFKNMLASVIRGGGNFRVLEVQRYYSAG